MRYLEARVNSAIVVPLGSGDEIRFGATVTLESPSGKKTTFQIVGEDEAKLGPPTLSWSSPLVGNLFGLKIGDSVQWINESRMENFKIVDVEYK